MEVKTHVKAWPGGKQVLVAGRRKTSQVERRVTEFKQRHGVLFLE